jgi:hypothetical protein
MGSATALSELCCLHAGPTGGGGAMERRLRQRTSHAATHGACCSIRHGALEAIELPTKVGHRGIRPILDTGTEERWDQYGCPGSCNDQQDEFPHVWLVPL